MKQYSLFFYLLLVFLAVGVASSCDKDEDETIPSMDGAIAFELPTYCYIGATFDLRSESTITDPAEESVSYFWRSSNDGILRDAQNQPKDTIPGLICKVQIPDSLGTFNVAVYAKADGYSDKTTAKQVVAIDTTFDKSVVGIVRGANFVRDSRDGEKYYYVEIGELYWFSENLRYAGDVTGGKIKDTVGMSYIHEDVLDKVYGRLYTWVDATKGNWEPGVGGLGKGPKGVCPDGWSIPMKEDWVDFGKALNGGEHIITETDGKDADEILNDTYNNMWFGLGQKAMVDATLNGEKMWPYSYKVKKTDTYKWNGIPSGNSLSKDGNFENLSLSAAWWSGTEADNTKASYRYMNYNNPFFPSNDVSKEEFGASVRCVKINNNN